MDTNKKGYVSMGVHILLMLVTCGIYLLVWNYKTTDFLNGIEGEEDRNPTTKLLLCMFVPFYMIYWIYVSAQRIDKLAASKGIASDSTTLCLILAILFPIGAYVIMQDKINKIALA